MRSTDERHRMRRSSQRACEKICCARDLAFRRCSESSCISIYTPVPVLRRNATSLRSRGFFHKLSTIHIPAKHALTQPYSRPLSQGGTLWLHTPDTQLLLPSSTDVSSSPLRPGSRERTRIPTELRRRYFPKRHDFFIPFDKGGSAQRPGDATLG